MVKTATFGKSGPRQTPNGRRPARREAHRTSPSVSGQLLSLQKRIGNQALQGLLRSGMMQAKLTIGRRDDVCEQEADRAADEAMRMPEKRVVTDRPSAVSEGHRRIQMKPG